MNGVVKNDNNYLNSKITGISSRIDHSFLDISNSIVVGSNNLSKTENEIIRNMNKSLKDLNLKLNKQMKEFVKAGSSLQNIDNFLSKEALNLNDLDEVIISNKLLLSAKGNNKGNNGSTFDNIQNEVNKNTKVWDITDELGTDNKVYFGIEEKILADTYYGYIQLKDGDDPDKLVNQMKEYVCELLRREDEGMTRSCRNDIMKISYTVDGDCIKIQLPGSFSTLVAAAGIAGMDPLSMLTDDNLVARNNKK